MSEIILPAHWMQTLDARFICSSDCRPGVSLDGRKWLLGGGQNTRHTYRRILVICIPTAFRRVAMNVGNDAVSILGVAMDIRNNGVTGVGIRFLRRYLELGLGEES